MRHHPIYLAVAAFLLVPAIGLPQSIPTYTVTTIVGTNVGGFSGDGASAAAAQIDGPTGVFVDSKGVLYIADQLNHRIRTVTSGTINTIAGNGTPGYAGDTKAATAANLNAPDSVFVDSKGNIYIADTANDVIRMVSGGNISTVAGNFALPGGYGGDNGQAIAAQLDGPAGLAVDANGNLYISDSKNNRIRKVANNIITTFAGTASAGFKGNNGPPAQANLNVPRGLALDASGALYIADSSSNMIRKVSGGVITLVAGSPAGVGSFAGDGGQAVGALLNRPSGVAVDSCGNVYIADTTNSRIRMVTANGAITTIGGNGKSGYSGDTGPALSAQFGFPAGVAVDSSGKVYVADTQNNVIRLLTPGSAPPCGGALPTIRAANGVISASDFGAFSSVAPGSWIEIYGSNLAADTRQWATSDFTGVTAPTSLDRTTVTIGPRSAFIDYVSSTQINAQVPSDIGSGQLQLTVGTSAGTSANYPITVALTQPGFYAPASFFVGGKQYVAATFTDGTTFVAPPGAIPGFTSRQAKPGETIILYGVGFGTVDANIPAGQIVQQANTISLPFQLSFGTAQATLQYSGLAGGFVGLYEFWAVVPNIADNDLVPLTFTLNGVSGTQTLYTAVKH